MPSQMTQHNQTPHDIIRETIRGVCSDGNADSGAVARAVIGELYAQGWQIMQANVIADDALCYRNPAPNAAPAYVGTFRTIKVRP